MPAMAGGKGYRMSSEEIRGSAFVVLPAVFDREIEDTGTVQDGTRVCDFMMWVYGRGVAPFADGRTSRRVGVDNLGREIFDAYVGEDQLWHLSPGVELTNGSDVAEGRPDWDGVAALAYTGPAFERFDELNLLADAVVGAALGDVAAYLWLVHYGWAEYAPTSGVPA